MKKVLSYILVFACLFSAVFTPCQAIEDSDVKYIYSINDLLKINNDLSGHYILMNDLDFSGVNDWEPIGDSIAYLADKVQTGFTEKETGEYFRGVLDGNGFSIKNFTIKGTPETKYDSSTGETVNTFGLFSHLSGALIKNLNFTNINIDVDIIDNAESGSFAKKTIVAALSASCKETMICDCQIVSGYFEPSSSKVYKAGLVAIDLGGCTYNNIINNANGYMNAGIVYACDHQGTVINNCTNNGNISGGVGIVGGGSLIINNCNNTGTITDARAGIIGRAYAYGDSDCMQINNCTNTGNIIFEPNGSSCKVGGIVGDFFVSSGSSSLTNCKNYADIYVRPTDTEGGYISGVGGIAGDIQVYNTEIVNVSNCVNYGEVVCDLIDCPISKPMDLGGVIGYWSGIYEIKKIINYGDVKLQNFNSDQVFVGGIIGYADNLNIKESMNYGNLLCENIEDNGDGMIFIGGVLCAGDNATLIECGNEGNIFTIGNIHHVACGGLVNRLFNSSLVNVYNSGDIMITDNNISDNDFLMAGSLSAIVSGTNETSINITNAYVSGNIKLNRTDLSTGTIGVGYIYSVNPKNKQIEVTNCYIDKTSQTKRLGNGDAEIIEKLQSITDFSEVSNFVGFDFEKIWTMAQNGYPVLINAKYTEEENALIGDLNNDGAIDAGDAVIISRYDAGLITLTADQLKAGDVNGDDTVDAGDAVIISRYDAGLISTIK